MSRKSVLAVALSVVVLLAMLVPAAVAAPEWLHGVEITAPIAPPVLVSVGAPDAVEDQKFDVKFTFTIVGTQEYDVLARARLIGEYGNVLAENKAEFDVNDIVTGANNGKITLTVPLNAPEGLYDVEVCVKEELGAFDDQTPKWCDLVENAVLVDWTPPKVWLDKPGESELLKFDAVWVTGQEYLLVGGAMDAVSGINDVWFEYHASPFTGWDWIQIPTDTYATPSGVANEYQAVWDSSLVRDDWALIRICATDNVGFKVCSKPQQVFVENRYTVNLRPGWNLISTPLMLYDDDIADVLFHQLDHKTVAGVWTYGPGGGQSWAPGMPGGIAEIKHGQGYWINMKGEDTLTFVGTWKNVGPNPPPTYAVVADWNLIGYTHWGTPTHPWWDDKSVLDYIGLSMAPALEALWRYDAASETYVPMNQMSMMVKGAGYWFASAQPGTINP